MNVLVTGAFGFVGSNLSAYLAERGHRLVALDVAEKEPSAYSGFFSWEQIDRIDWASVDAVVHLAGKAHDTRDVSDPQSYFDVNVGLTKKVIERFSRGGAEARRVFVFFSSVKAVADRVEGVLTEETEPEPKTPYGQSKLEAEREVLKFESSKVRELATANGANSMSEKDFRTLEVPNFRTYILRPCMIHGPENKGNLNLLHGVVSRGLPWPLGAFENRRSFASIGNVCAVVEGLLKGGAPSGMYQVADDEALSTNELIQMMAEALGHRAKIWRVSAGLVRAAARMGDRLRLPLNSERLKKLTESYVVLNAKIKRTLGWERMPVDSREGMRRTLKSFPAKTPRDGQV
jgi:nucleoside-diphosphate-sugar epimerase